VEAMAALNGLIREELCHFPELWQNTSGLFLFIRVTACCRNYLLKLAEYAQSKLEKGASKSGCMTGLPAA
jgi:hypothetical protein